VATAAGAAVVVVVVVLGVPLAVWWGVEPEHAASTSPANPVVASTPHRRRERAEGACVRWRSMMGVLIVGDAPCRGRYVR